MNNGKTQNRNYICTDSDCMQYVKHIAARRYDLIQCIWLDTTGSDRKSENGKDEYDNYVVVQKEIDLDTYSEEEIEVHISSYYNSIEQMEESYGMTRYELDSIIAECIFENVYDECQYDNVSEIVSWEDAENIIQKYITTLRFG